MGGGDPNKYSGPSQPKSRKVPGVPGLVQKKRGGITGFETYTTKYTKTGLGKRSSNTNLLQVIPSKYAQNTMTTHKNNPNLAVLRSRPTINTKIPISPNVASFLEGLKR